MCGQVCLSPSTPECPKERARGALVAFVMCYIIIAKLNFIRNRELSVQRCYLRFVYINVTLNVSF